MKCSIIVILSIAMLSIGSQADADNWGHWRGVDGNGVAADATPPTQWSGTENVKWKVAVPGKGSGSPVVWEDKVFVVSAVPVGGDSARHRRSGKLAAALRAVEGNLVEAVALASYQNWSSNCSVLIVKPAKSFGSRPPLSRPRMKERIRPTVLLRLHLLPTASTFMPISVPGGFTVTRWTAI